MALLALAVCAPVQAREIDLVVIHATGGPGCKDGRLWHAPGGTLESNRRYFASRKGISYHYLIGRDGAVLAGVREAEVAHHARGHNLNSIGIELVNDGDGKDPFPPAQIQSLIGILGRLKETYGIDARQVKGHSEIDGRAFSCGGRLYKQKIDPGGEYPGSKGNFPWAEVRDALR